MCQQDFDFGVLSVGKMERRRESRNSLSKGGSDAYPNYHYSRNISPSLEENSLEDGSQGSEISGLDHQLPSMQALAASRWSKGSSDTAPCLSCSRQREDDYGGNDFGECHQHQLQKQHKTTNKICRQVDRKSTFYSQFGSSRASEIDMKEDLLLQHTSSSSSPPESSKSGGTLGVATSRERPCRQHFFGGMSRALWMQLGMLILLSLNLQGISAVRINTLSVPTIVRNGTEDSVILNCDYSIEDHEREGLVVKWYFTNKQTQVYQWIPKQKPTSLGILKGKLNLDYQTDQDNYKMNSLQIMRPTTELSGKWICHVSTFDGEAIEAAWMLVFAPEKEMEMKVVENRRGNFVNISCWATRVFPKPRMTFYQEEQKVPDVTVWYEENDGAYDVRAYKVIEDTSLSSMIGSVFDCELEIPTTNYVKRRTTVFEPGSLELKDAMRMSHGPSRVSWELGGVLLPLTISFVARLAFH